MNRNRNQWVRGALLATLSALVALGAACKKIPPGTFATPEEAVQAANAVAGTGDTAKLEEIFGPGSADLFRSGDEAQDRRAVTRVKELIAQKVTFQDHDADTKVALFGEEEWPFPIPLVREGERWKFDTAKGREELLNRRIGFNELSTLASLHAYVDAQVVYFSQGRDGNRPAFAQKFMSSEGKQDGLYWPAAEGENESPLGDLLAHAAIGEHQAGEPYNGYNYRILTGQGKNAPGGERSYLDAKGLMTTGFAAIAWPAKYGNSGVMTFIVNQRGMVYQKDLGAGTEAAVAAIQSFDPDSSWTPTGDTLADIPEDGDDEGDAGAEEGTEEGAAEGEEGAG